MSPELELLDILQAEDVKLSSLFHSHYPFPDAASAATSLLHMIKDQTILIIDEQKQPLHDWELTALFRTPAWITRQDLAITAGPNYPQ